MAPQDEEECLLGSVEDFRRRSDSRSERTSDASERTPVALAGETQHSKVRNLVAFWLLGLCNNYDYVIMLSAAVDIIAKLDVKQPHDKTETAKCTPQSTGAILLADILPALLIKLCAPFINANAHVSVALVVLMSAGSLILTSVARIKWLAFVGVVVASLGSGLGEITFLKYSSHYDRNTVSAWSSGTGGAGVLGATLYFGITFLLTPEKTLLVMLVIPVLLAISFWLILEHPRRAPSESCDHLSESAQDGIGCCGPRAALQRPTLSFTQKIRAIKPLLKYMVPLGLVYFAEYFINQGLFELITFNNQMTTEAQYRLYQVCYQMGVLVSRSSVNIFQIDKLWLLPILQFANAILFTFEAVYRFIPSIIIVAALIVVEGLFGGASYVNTFYKVSQEVSPHTREFSMGVTSMSDSLGITASAFVSIWAHNMICAYRNSL